GSVICNWSRESFDFGFWIERNLSNPPDSRLLLENIRFWCRKVSLRQWYETGFVRNDVEISFFPVFLGFFDQFRRSRNKIPPHKPGLFETCAAEQHKLCVALGFHFRRFPGGKNNHLTGLKLSAVNFQLAGQDINGTFFDVFRNS